MLMIRRNPQWISEQLLCVFISIIISTYMGNAYDVPSKDPNHLPWDTVLNAPTTDDKIVNLCDHHQKNYKSHDNIMNEENSVKYIESNGDEITYHNSDENEIEKSGILHNNFLLDDTCYRNVTVLYLAGYDDEIFELRNDLLKKGNGNELLIFFFLYSDHKFFNIGKIHTNVIFFNESVLKYSHYYYLNSETVKNICCYNKLPFENLIESVPDEAIDEKKSKYFTVYPQKGSDWYEFIIPKGKDMFVKDIIVDLNKNKDNKLNKPTDSTSSILDQPNDNEIYYVNEDFLNTCIQSKYLKHKNEKKTINKNQILKSYTEISPPIKLESTLEDILDKQSKSILHNTKKVLVPCNDNKLEQNNEKLSTFIPVTSTVTNSKSKDAEKTRVAKIFKDKSVKTFQHHKDTTYYKLPKMLDSYTKTIDQVYSYKNPFSDVDVNGLNIGAPILFQGNKIDKISNNNNNRVLPNGSQYYLYEKTPNNILLNTDVDIGKPNYKAFPHIHTLNQCIPNKKLPTKVVSKNTDFNFHTQIKNIPFSRFKPPSSFSDGSYKILDSYIPYNNNYHLNPNYVTHEQNLKPLKNKKYSTKNPFVDFSIPMITSSSNIKINDKHKKMVYLPEAYSLYRLNSATQKQKDESNKILIDTPSILNIPCQKLTNDKSRILNVDSSNILNTPRQMGASLINTNEKLSASPQAHDLIFYSLKYNTNDENKPEEIKRSPYYNKYNELLPASYIPKFYTTNRNFSHNLYQSIPTKICQPLENILESSNAPMNGNPNRIQKVTSDFLLFKEKPIISGILSEKQPQNIILRSSGQEGAQATDDDIEKKYFINTHSPLNVVICKHKNAIPNSNINTNLPDNLNFIKKVNIPILSPLKQESYENASWFKKYHQNIRELLPYTKLSYLPKIKSSTKIPIQNSFTPSDPIYSSENPKSPPHITMSVTPALDTSETVHMSQKPVNIKEFPSSIDLSIPSKNIKRTQFVSIPKFNFTYHLSPKPQTNTVSEFSIKSPAIPLSQFLSQLSPCQLTHNKPKSQDISLISSYLSLYKPIEPDLMSGTIFKLPQHVLKSNTPTLNQEPTSNVFNNKNLSFLTNLSQQWFLPQSNLPSPITSQIVPMPETNKILYRPEQNFKEYTLKPYLLSKPQVVTTKAYTPIISIPKVSSPPLSLYEAIPNKLTIEEISPIPSYNNIFKVNKPDVSSNTIFSLPQERLKSNMPSFYQESPTTKDTFYLPITSPYMVVPERNLALQLAKQNLDQYPLKPYLSAKLQSVPTSPFPIILSPISTPEIKSSSRSPVPAIRYIPKNDLSSPVTSQHVAMAEINKYLHQPKKNINQYPPRDYSTPEAVTKKGFSIKSPITSLPRISSPPVLPFYKVIHNKPINKEIFPTSSYMERKLDDPDISTNTIFKPNIPNLNQGNPCTAKSSQYRNWPQDIIPIISPYVELPDSIQKLHLSNQNLNLYHLKTYLSPQLQSEPALPFPSTSQNTSILALTTSSKSPVSAIRNWPHNILTSSIASPHLATPERNKNLHISKQNVIQYPPKLYSSSKPQPVFIKSPITLFPEVMSSSSPLPLYKAAPNNSIIQEIVPIIKSSMSSNVIFPLPQQPLKSSMTNFNEESPTTFSNKNFEVQTNPCVTNHVFSQYRVWPQNNIPPSIASPYVVTPEINQNLHLPKKSTLQPYLSLKLPLRASSLQFTQLTHIPVVKSSSLPKPAVKIILLNHSHKKLTLPTQHFKPNLLTKNQEPVLSKNIFNSLQLEPYILKPTIAEPFQLKKNQTQISLPKYYNYNKATKIHDSSPETIVQNALLPIPSSISSTLPMPSLPTSYKLSYPKYKTYKSKEIYSLPKQFYIPYDKFKVFPTNEYKSIPKSKLNTVPSTSTLTPTITKIWSPKSKAYAPLLNRISPPKQFNLRHERLLPTEFSKPIDKNVNSSTMKSSLTQPTFKYSLNLNSHRIPLPSLSSFNQYPYQPISSDFNPLNISTKIDSISPIAISLNNKLYFKPGSITFKFLSPHLLPKKHSQNKIISKLSSSSNSLLEKSLQYQIPTYKPTIQDTVFKVKVDNLPLSSKDNTNNKKHFPNYQTLPISNMKSFIPDFKVLNEVIRRQNMPNRKKTRIIPDLASYSTPLNTINLPVKPKSYKHTAHPLEIHTPESYIKPPSKYSIKLQPLHSHICNLAPYSYYSSLLRTRKKYSSNKPYIFPYISFPSKMNLKSPNSFILSDITSKSIQLPLKTGSEYSKPDLPCILSSTLAQPIETSILPFTSLGRPLSEMNPNQFRLANDQSLNLLTEQKLLKNPSTLPFKYDLISHHRHYEPLQTLDTESFVLHSNLPNYSMIHNKYKNIHKSFYKYQNYLTYLKENQVIPKKEFKNALLSPSPIFNLHSKSNLDIESSNPYTNLSNHYTWSQTTPKFTYKYHNNFPLVLQDQVNFNKDVKDKATNKHLPLQQNSSFIPFKSYLSYIKSFIKTPSSYQTDLQGTSAPIFNPSYQSIYVKNGPSSQFKTTNILSIPSKWIESITPQASALGPFKSDLTNLSLPLLKSSCISTSSLHHPVYKTLETLIPPPNLIKKSTWPLNKPKFTPKNVDKYQNYQQTFNSQDRTILNRNNINTQPFLTPIAEVASKSKSFNKFKSPFKPLNIQAFKIPFSISNADTTHKNIILQPHLPNLKPFERSSIQDYYQTSSPYQLVWPKTISTDNFKDMKEPLYHIKISKLPTNWQLKKSLTLDMNIIKPNLAYSSPTILSSAKEPYHKNADFLIDKPSAFEKSSPYPLHSNLNVNSGTYSIYKGTKYFKINKKIPNKIVNYIDTGKYNQINYLQNKPNIKNQLYSNILYKNDNYKKYYPIIFSVKHRTQILSPLGKLNTYPYELITDRERNLKIPIAKILEKSCRPDLGLREIVTNNEINENIPYKRAQGTKHIGKEIPLPNISILKYDPREINNSVEIETDNPDIFIKAWTSRIEIIKPRIVYDTFHVQALNFEPLVKEVGKYDPNVVNDVVKSYVEKYYGEPIVLKGMYNFYKPYIISNVDNEYLKHGKIYLVWPTLCDCGCNCFGCRCYKKFS